MKVNERRELLAVLIISRLTTTLQQLIKIFLTFHDTNFNEDGKGIIFNEFNVFELPILNSRVFVEPKLKVTADKESYQSHCFQEN